MNKILQSEINRFVTQVNAVIAEDSFPEKIEPENLRSAVRAYPMRGGKRLRPVLTMWACGALNGDPQQALFAAAAIEIYHNWTLVHDDLIDCDDFRRGIPTTHIELKRSAECAFSLSSEISAKFGRDFAILAGDIQHGWAINMLLRSAELGVQPGLLLALTRRLQESVNRELISGEALDVEFPLLPLDSISEAKVFRMISGKTSTLLRYAVQCGGAIALKRADFLEHPLLELGDYAESLGIVFQLRDDYLGVFGAEEKFGKPLCSDFQERKPTILYLEAMKRLSKSGAAELSSMMGLPAYGRVEIDKIRTLLTESGAAKEMQSEMERLTSFASDKLSCLPDSKYKNLLNDLLRELLTRMV